MLWFAFQWEVEKNSVAISMRVIPENTKKKPFNMLTSLWFPNEFRLFWLHSIKWQYLNTTKKLLIQWIHWEREKKKVTNEKLNFRISISVKINLFKNVGEATSIGIFGNNTSMQYLKCVRWCMFIFFLWISWTKSLYIKIHFIWHALCIAIHWIEPFKRVYIDSIGNNQTSKRGTNTFFLAYFFFNSMHTIVMHHKFNGRFTLLHVILYTKKSLVWFHPGVVVVFFFSIYTENTWPVSHRFNLIARPNNIIVYFLKSNRSKRKIFSNFMR